MSEMLSSRRFPRAVWISHVFAEAGDQERFACDALNLSASGCFLQTPRAPRNGVLALTFVDRAGREAVRCRGQIVRRERDGVGVRFVGLASAQLFALARLIAPRLA